MPETTRTIVLEVRNQYGRRTMRVVEESPYADAIRVLTKKITIEMPDVTALKALGFEVMIRETAAQKL